MKFPPWVGPTVTGTLLAAGLAWGAFMTKTNGIQDSQIAVLTVEKENIKTQLDRMERKLDMLLIKPK